MDKEFEKGVRECEEQMTAIATYDGLTLERRGLWVWVSGNTKRHHVALKGAGFSFAPKKKMWYWKPSWLPFTKGKSTSMDYIRNTYEGVSVNTDDINIA